MKYRGFLKMVNQIAINPSDPQLNKAEIEWRRRLFIGQVVLTGTRKG